MLKKSVIFLISSVFMIHCSDQGSVDPTPPAAVQMVQKEAGFDTLDVERGIDAEPDPGTNKNGIKVMWYRHPDEAKLAYFKIYRSSDPAGQINFNLIATTENLANELDTVFVNTQDLELNTRYSYYVTAISEQDAESAPSDTVHYTLIQTASNLTLNNNAGVINNPEMNFSWGQVIDAREYILRVERIITTSFSPLVYIEVFDSYHKLVTFSISGDWLKTTFPNGNYRWRVDCVGADLFTGSEAEGSEFTVNWSY